MIIAEIGQNWCGGEMLALELIGLAKANGADLVKFQLYDSKKLYGEYQDTELSFERAKFLFNYGKDLGIEVFFSVFDIERVKWCEEIGVRRYKIACTMRDKTVWNAISQTGKEAIVSAFTGNIFPVSLKSKILYCVPKYPADIRDYHLNPIICLDGISDHTVGLDCAKIALARGAKTIEKHFAIDHQTGVDAQWSMNPEELRELKRFEKVARQAL